MPLQINGKTIGNVFYGSTQIAEAYRGATLVWQNVPKVTITKISDVWTLLRSPEHIVRSNGRYWNSSDQLVQGVPNWNDWAIPEVPFRIVLAPTFTAGMGMFSSYLGGYPAKNKLVTAPEMDTRNLTDMTAFFWNAINLENIPEYTITACTSLKDFVGNCPKVKSVVLRDCGKVQDLRNAFGAGSETMPACTRVELHGLGPSLPNGHVLDLSKTALTAEGATALFNSLGTVTSGRTVTLKLPDSALGARQGVARSKGWTVTPVVDEVVITGTSGTQARDSFRAALTARGLDYKTVETIPFFLGTSQVTNMREMFRDCASLTSVPDMDTSNVTDMSRMFQSCSALTSVPDIDTSNVTNMSRMFQRCTALTVVPDMDTSNVTDMSNMFFNCSSLTSVPDMDTSNVTDMSNMLYYCFKLTSAPDMYTSNVTNMFNMFSDCSSLTSVPDMDTASATNMSYMFYNCKVLTDGNVRLVGKKSGVNTSYMILDSGLTRLPFYDTNGNWTG